MKLLEIKSSMHEMNEMKNTLQGLTSDQTLQKEIKETNENLKKKISVSASCGITLPIMCVIRVHKEEEKAVGKKKKLKKY